MKNYPKPVTKSSHKIIMNYLDNSIYKIKIGESKYGVGFFCYIKCHNNNIPVFITNNKIINEKYYLNYNNIEILIYNELISIEFGSIYYIDEYLDLSIIEIKENHIIKILDIDDDIYKDELELCLNQDSIYIIHYDKDICVSYGIIKNIKNEELLIYCNINSDSNYYPIFNSNTNKLIGIYQKNYKYYPKGIYFKYLIDKFKFKYNENFIINKDNYNNEINIVVSINKEDIGQKIYFLGNKYFENDNLKELNETNTELNINKKKEKYTNYFLPDNEGIYDIDIKFNIDLLDWSYMFAGCENIIYINFILFNTRYIKYIKYMFYNVKI